MANSFTIKIVVSFMVAVCFGFAYNPRATASGEKCCLLAPLPSNECVCKPVLGTCWHCKPITNPCPHGCGPGQPQPPR